MKFLLNLMKKFEPTFKEGALKKLYPAYEMMETILFEANPPTVKSPMVRDAMNTKRFMWLVVLGLLPATLWGVYANGLRPLLVIVVSYAVGGAIEVAFSVARKEEVSEGFLVTGLLFGLIVPATVPIWVIALGVAFGVIFGKEIFGGTGRNLFNPALLGFCFIYLSWPVHLAPPQYIIPLADWPGHLPQYLHSGNLADVVTGATPLSMAKAGGYEAVLAKYSIQNMFLGLVPGAAGETSTLLLLAGGLFIIATRVANWRIPLGIFLGLTVLSGILHMVKGAWYPPHFHWVTGGFALGALFMATDPVSAPDTAGGKWLYGLACGLCIVVIRQFSPLPEGTMFSILLMNLFAPLFDEIFLRRKAAKEKAYG